MNALKKIFLYFANVKYKKIMSIMHLDTLKN